MNCNYILWNFQKLSEKLKWRNFIYIYLDCTNNFPIGFHLKFLWLIDGNTWFLELLTGIPAKVGANIWHTCIRAHTYACTHVCMNIRSVSDVRDSKFLANVYIVCCLAAFCYFGFSYTHGVYSAHLIHRRLMNDIIAIDFSCRRWCYLYYCCCCCYYLCANQVFVYCAQSHSFNRLLFVHTVILKFILHIK